MNGTGAFTASGIVAADKGTVSSGRTVFVGEFLDMIAHLKTTVSTINKAGEDTSDAVCERRFAHFLLVNSDHSFPDFA